MQSRSGGAELDEVDGKKKLLLNALSSLWLPLRIVFWKLRELSLLLQSIVRTWLRTTILDRGCVRLINPGMYGHALALEWNKLIDLLRPLVCPGLIFKPSSVTLQTYHRLDIGMYIFGFMWVETILRSMYWNPNAMVIARAFTRRWHCFNVYFLFLGVDESLVFSLDS